MDTGYEFKLFPNLHKNYVNWENTKRNDLIFDKKTSIHYNISSRFKNNTKGHDQNTETLDLTFDTSLSSTLYFEHFDLENNKVLTMQLMQSKQPSWGKTKLFIMLQLIDEKQQIFTDTIFHYLPTVKGPITKRLQAYQEEFNQVIQKTLEKYKSNGFQVNPIYKTRKLASYIYFVNKSRNEKLLSTYSKKFDLNVILTIYSILTNDSLYTNKYFDEGYLFNFPYSDQNDFAHISPTLLPQAEVDLLNQSIELFTGNGSKIQALINRCNKLNDNRLDYFKFRNEFISTIVDCNKKQ